MTKENQKLTLENLENASGGHHPRFTPPWVKVLAHRIHISPPPQFFSLDVIGQVIK